MIISEYVKWLLTITALAVILYKFPSYKARLPKIFMIVLWEESRKVCFGVLLVHVATWLLVKALISAQIWAACAILSIGLIGGGTVLDKFGGVLLEKIFGKEKDAPPPAS